MRKTICHTEYDTDQSTLVAKFTSGEPGDPAGYEETLYETAQGRLFLYVNGGPSSLHPKEDIRRISAVRAEQWRDTHGLR